MNNPKLLVNSLNTLFWSWGSDTPAEAIWAGNELLDWLKEEFGIDTGMYFLEDDVSNQNGDIILKIKELTGLVSYNKALQDELQLSSPHSSQAISDRVFYDEYRKDGKRYNLYFVDKLDKALIEIENIK